MRCRIFDYLHGEGDGIRAKNNQIICHCLLVNYALQSDRIAFRFRKTHGW